MMSFEMFHQFGKEMNFSWHRIIAFFLTVLYVVEHFYVEGEAAPCEGKFFVVLSAFPLFHSTTQS